VYSLILILVVLPGLLLALQGVRKTLAEEQRSSEISDAVQQAGLIEPPSLHPVIVADQCIGCASCVDACPEGRILGMIEGKAKLVEPTRCIGHGACREACPTHAIQLVFGTASRGIEIPEVSPEFESNVPGIFIAGELGGMGLIRNAVEQGKQAIDSIARLEGLGSEARIDVLIVGAGPAGIAASLAAKEKGLRAVTVEQDSLGGTVSHYPRAKIVMTAPVNLPLIGKVRFTETTKEKLLAFWEDVVAKSGLEIRFKERVEQITRDTDGFEIRTSRSRYHSRAVLLAVGRRGTPRTLGVEGEELSKVSYRMIDPEQYRGKHLLVVGGGDSALEAAASAAESGAAAVTLSYRSATFSRAKQKNRARIEGLVGSAAVRVLMSSKIQRIEADNVTIEAAAEQIQIPNDAVVICAGGILPTAFLKEIGVECSMKFGVA
jgi:thioredoxin reductase (NADPH)